jgi:hypothetical protein
VSVVLCDRVYVCCIDRMTVTVCMSVALPPEELHAMRKSTTSTLYACDLMLDVVSRTLTTNLSTFVYAVRSSHCAMYVYRFTGSPMPGERAASSSTGSARSNESAEVRVHMSCVSVCVCVRTRLHAVHTCVRV